MNDKKKKKFIIPEAEVVNFDNEDIITLSNGGEAGANWLTDDNGEGWTL